MRFIASIIQLYVERDKPAPSASTHASSARTQNAQYCDPNYAIAASHADHAEVKTYHGHTYAHLAGQLMVLPTELRYFKNIILIYHI